MGHNYFLDICFNRPFSIRKPSTTEGQQKLNEHATLFLNNKLSIRDFDFKPPEQ